MSATSASITVKSCLIRVLHGWALARYVSRSITPITCQFLPICGLSSRECSGRSLRQCARLKCVPKLSRSLKSWLHWCLWTEIVPSVVHLWIRHSWSLAVTSSPKIPSLPSWKCWLSKCAWWIHSLMHKSRRLRLHSSTVSLLSHFMHWNCWLAPILVHIPKIIWRCS